MTVTAVPIQPVKRSYIWWIVIGIAVAVAGAFLLARQGDDYWAKSQRDSGIQTTASGLKYKILTPGTGAHPTDTDVALVTYEGKLRNGTTFDKSQQPMPMPLQGVVPGFTEALKLMNNGAKIRVWLPAKLAYGEAGKGPIPPNSPLIFDIELLQFISQQQYQQIMMQQQMGGGAPGGPGGAPGGPGGAPGGAPGESLGGEPGPPRGN